jgi:hypothetical protein
MNESPITYREFTDAVKELGTPPHCLGGLRNFLQPGDGTGERQSSRAGVRREAARPKL